MRTMLSLTFLAARIGDWLTTMLLGGVEIEGNPLAMHFGLFPTMAVTSMLGLALVLFAWSKRPRTGRMGMAALLLMAFGVLLYNLTLVVMS